MTASFGIATLTEVGFNHFFHAKYGEQPGDFIYFAPYVPHQERNLDAAGTLDFLVVRSDNDRIVVKLDVAPAASPEAVY